MKHLITIKLPPNNKAAKRLAEASKRCLKAMQDDLESGRFDDIINNLPK